MICSATAGLLEPGAGRRALAQHRLLPETPLVLRSHRRYCLSCRLVTRVKERDDLRSLLLHHAALAPPLSRSIDHGEPRGKPRRDDLVQKPLPLAVAHGAAVRPVTSEVDHVADEGRVADGT